MIIFSDKIKNTSEGIWNKTRQLKKLIDIGIHVPEFIAIPTLTVWRLPDGSLRIKDLCDTIRRDFPQISYAVRSSSLDEDMENSSMAGQYHTELDIPPEWLEEAIMQVIKYRIWQDETKISKLSIIIQKYIQADYAGVCFTRNPIAGWEMVFEYHRWIWEDVVSGNIIPEILSFYSYENKKIIGFNPSIFQKIETNFDHPQDIEWCTRDNSLYILQSRPITTISKEKYQEILFLEQNISQENDYFFEKNEISEIAPRPTPFTLSLLEKIYWENGPIMNVYKRHHMDYIPQAILKIIGNELYIDRESELQTLLPAFSILNRKYTPKINSIQWIWRSTMNIFWTAFLQEDSSLINKLKISLEWLRNHISFNEALGQFLKDYELIFETNIFASKYLKKLELLIKNEGIFLSELLQSDPSFFSMEKIIPFETENLNGLQGNTLEINDTGKIAIWTKKYITSENIKNWWNTLPEWKRKWYGKHISRGITYQKYREYGRLLMIKNVNSIRNILIQVLNFENKNDIFFYTINEISSDIPDESLHEKRKEIYEEYNKWNLPSKLTYRFIRDNKYQKNIGISPWKTEWYLVDISMLESQKGPKILKTQILSPDLTKYFPEIVGIISEKWWLLSHLAIMARERNIPIIISSVLDIPLWSYISINGSTGDIYIISER